MTNDFYFFSTLAMHSQHITLFQKNVYSQVGCLNLCAAEGPAFAKDDDEKTLEKPPPLILGYAVPAVVVAAVICVIWILV